MWAGPNDTFGFSLHRDAWQIFGGAGATPLASLGLACREQMIFSFAAQLERSR